jgi:bifunctional pyridoxal-dependent enzyme with beta-cystathionase and maltose regulon repressor activities
VLGEMANAHGIIVINDEAHHAWRIPAESKVKGSRIKQGSITPGNTLT